MNRRTRDRSRWTGWVGGKSFSQEPNNRFERDHIFLIKRLVKHFVPIRGVHAAAAHFMNFHPVTLCQNRTEHKCLLPQACKLKKRCTGACNQNYLASQTHLA
jgi:hypothetical protein